MAYSELDTVHYKLGKGVLMMQQQETFADADGYRDFGNVSAINLTVEIEKIEHFSSRSGAKLKDGETLIQKKATGSITIDDPNMNNLMMFFLGKTLSETVQSSGSGLTFNTFTAALDRWGNIYDGSGNRYYNISNLVVKDETDTTTYVLGTDYEQHLASGQIRPLSSGSISEDDVLHLTFDVAALNYYDLDALGNDDVKGHIYFRGDPPDGKIQDFEGYASLTPTGDLPWISDDYATMQFNIEFLENDKYNGLVDIIERGYT